MRKLEGKTAVVTGSSYGIGRGVALKLGEQGANVVVNYSKSLDKAQSVVSEILSKESRAISVRADVSQSDQVGMLIDTCLQEFGRIDILVNNAGILPFGNIEDITDEVLDRVFKVNFYGTFYCCREAVPIMKKQGYGKIVNITSIASQRGDNTTAAAYGSSKGAQSVLTKSLARQLGPFGINVNAVAPHAVITPMMDYWDQQKRDSMKNKIPVRRLGNPEDVAVAVLFLVSDEADFITGQILNVNGGFLMDS
jgi:3-oxoacyl-[acyl-carrier protein] reductase